MSTRIEEDNTNAIDTFVVPVDGSAAPRRITHEGKSVAQPRWTDDNLLQYSLNAKTNSDVFVGGACSATANSRRTHRSSKSRWLMPNATPVSATAAAAGVLSADGKWRAQARELPRAPVAEAAGTDFEKRHAARFKGRTFDWMRFQQDGQDYPTPDPRTRPAAEISDRDQPMAASRRRSRSLGMRPPTSRGIRMAASIAFTADDRWRNEQAYEQPDIYTVTTGGEVKRLTNDGYVWSSLSYSPDGQFLLSERTFGTGMIIEKKLSHGGSDDLLVWPAAGGAADQSHRVVGSRAERSALVGGFEVRLLHRREGRHHARVPRRRSGRRARSSRSRRASGGSTASPSTRR